MPRALAVHRIVVPSPDRERYFERLRARRDFFQRANCNFWVYEESDLHGAFLEFAESKDAAALVAALAAAPDAPSQPPRVYTEVELS